MKFSINTLRHINKKYGCADDLMPDGLDALIERIGSKLGAIEEIMPLGSKYDGVIIVNIISCEHHPDADRLNVCLIDDGGKVADVPRNEEGHVQVVCGAPNVAAGMTVAWLPPGSTVPSTYDTDPFVLSSRELRGIVSHGMLASPKELALGDSHEGILAIDGDVPAGTSFAEHYGLAGDVVIDIENKMFTHRPDCFGWLGLAREFAGIQGQEFTSPAWYRHDAEITLADSNELKVRVRNELPELTPRFVIIPMAGITVGPSPVWLQARLSRVGLRPINNIVDLTNFFMLVTGQPLHAYDYDKVVAQDPDADHATIVVRHPHEQETLTLLNGKEITPREEAILIASDTKAIGLAGVMGGSDTEVDASTKNIILECATFDMYSIRRTSMAHGIFSDAVTRFNKGQSPLQNMAVAARLVDEIIRITGGRVAGEVIDINNLPLEVNERGAVHKDVNVEAAFINSRLGLDLTAEAMQQLLENVEFKVELLDRTMVDEADGSKFQTETLTVRAPFWRTDIQAAEDIVEEVGRLYGFDKLPLVLPKRDLAPTVTYPKFDLQSAVRQAMARAGANELLTYSFVHGKLLNAVGQDPDLAYSLSNALSPDLQYYRTSLTPSLLDKVLPNIKAGFDQFALFEIGKAHIKGSVDDEGLPAEFNRLACVFAANEKAAMEYRGAPYYQAREYLGYLGGAVSNADANWRYIPLSDYDFQGSKPWEQMAAPYEPGRSAVVLAGEHRLGIVGEYRAAVRKKLKLPAFAAGFEIDLSVLQPDHASQYVPMPKFPKVAQDICLRVPSAVTYREVSDRLFEQLVSTQPQPAVSSLSPVDIYQREEDTEHKQITLRYMIASYDRTLTDPEVAQLLNAAAAAVCQNFGAEII